MAGKEQVYQTLDELGISYKAVDHPPVFTVEAMEDLGLQKNGTICKNLFLCDDKGKRFYLVVMPGDKRADLQRLAGILGCKKPRFASEEKVAARLQLEKGSITPLAVVNDDTGQIPVFLDAALDGPALLGVHPNTNTATVFLAFEDLKRYLDHYGNPASVVKL